MCKMSPYAVRVVWCAYCTAPVYQPVYYNSKGYRGYRAIPKFCSRECFYASRRKPPPPPAAPRPVETHRICTVCGRVFKRRKYKTRLSRARLCSRACQNISRSSHMERTHEEARKNPEEYRRWVWRDYSAMGKAPSHNKDRTPRTTSLTKGAGW